MRISGDLHFMLEYGSKSHYRSCDGIEIDQSFPFQTKIRHKISEEFPTDNYEIADYGVNTSSCFGEDDYNYEEE